MGFINLRPGGARAAGIFGVTKAELRHGELGARIEHKCKLALSTAKLYMQLARIADRLKKRGVNLNETSVRAMRAMVSESHQRKASKHHRTASTPHASTNDIQRCILLLNHVFDHGDPDAVEAELLSELLRLSAELKKRRTRRDATGRLLINHSLLPPLALL
jgi:hypothetical protein